MQLLEVNNLCLDFKTDGHWLPVVSELSFGVGRGEILALVGESGCGKSVTCMALTRLLPTPPARYRSGEVKLRHRGRTCSILELPERKLREIRGGGIAYIFQEPAVSLNPVFRVGSQIAEAILLHRPDVTDVRGEVIELLYQVGIPEPQTRIDSFPHEMSGGMQQRIMIAMALASNPELLVADEPTTALDVTIQAQILELLAKIRKEREMAIILVTHNLGIVAGMADRVIVMYAGHQVEAAPVDTLLRHPRHPYTRALLRAVPVPGNKLEKLQTIPGNVPSPANFPTGCRFYGRCEYSASLSAAEQALCRDQVPEWRAIGGQHFCRCQHVKQEDTRS